MNVVSSRLCYNPADVRERHETTHSPLDTARDDPEPVEGSKAGSDEGNQQSRWCVRARRLSSNQEIQQPADA